MIQLDKIDLMMSSSVRNFVECGFTLVGVITLPIGIGYVLVYLLPLFVMSWGWYILMIVCCIVMTSINSLILTLTIEIHHNPTYRLVTTWLNDRIGFTYMQPAIVPILPNGWANNSFQSGPVLPLTPVQITQLSTSIPANPPVRVRIVNWYLWLWAWIAVVMTLLEYQFIRMLLKIIW